MNRLWTSCYRKRDCIAKNFLNCPRSLRWYSHLAGVQIESGVLSRIDFQLDRRLFFNQFSSNLNGQSFDLGSIGNRNASNDVERASHTHVDRRLHFAQLGAFYQNVDSFLCKLLHVLVGVLESCLEPHV